MANQDPLPSWLQLHPEPPLWLRATVDELLEAWSINASWDAKSAGAFTPEPARRTGPLVEAFDELSNIPRSALLVGTDSPWTAMFAQWGPRVPNRLELAPLVPCEVVHFDFTGDGATTDLGFSWWAAPASEAQALFREPVPHRTVRLWHENGKWHFEQYGEALSVENTTMYGRRARSERLDADTLLSYAEQLEIPLGTIDAYTGETALLFPTQWPDPPHEHSAAEEERLNIEWQRMRVARVHARQAR